jgi:methionyl-tRNA synthetase
MNTSAQQARSFFLRCRAKASRPLRTCSRYYATPTPSLRAACSPAPKLDDSSQVKPYYVTTPIYYVNAEPHVGHLYSLVLADVLKRWHELKHPHTKSALLTGTDEHGMKVQKAAELAKASPDAFCAFNAEKFKQLAQKANISYDRFIRTTDKDHKAAVEAFWLKLLERGHIYQSKHEGWYCVSDETFYPESQIHTVIDPKTGQEIRVSKETGKEVMWTSEDNYHFRLSRFQDQLLSQYEKHADAIVPQNRMNFIVAEIKNGLTDLSVSRPSSRLQWGIRVPNDDSQTIYVWLDALINYITMAGYPNLPENNSIWPPDCQVIGKDIIRFHCIYWPAFLMALDLPVPRRFLSHAHWTMNQEKMSKSLGNVVNPFNAIDTFGIDPIRYYMVRDGGYADDSSYNAPNILHRHKVELQDGLGNLMSRIFRAKAWNPAERVLRGQRITGHTGLHRRENFVEYTTQLVQEVSDAMHAANPRRALDLIMTFAPSANVYFHNSAPWKLVKETDAESQEAVDLIIYHTLELLRIICILLQPFMPEKMKLALDMLGVKPEERTLEQAVFGWEGEYGAPLEGVRLDDSGKIAESLFPPVHGVS